VGHCYLGLGKLYRRTGKQDEAASTSRPRWRWSAPCAGSPMTPATSSAAAARSRCAPDRRCRGSSSRRRRTTPKHLAEKILTSKAALEGERKQVTVLFADLKGSMELCLRLQHGSSVRGWGLTSRGRGPAAGERGRRAFVLTTLQLPRRARGGRGRHRAPGRGDRQRRGRCFRGAPRHPEPGPDPGPRVDSAPRGRHRAVLTTDLDQARHPVPDVELAGPGPRAS
jgi:hypothetical protein